MENKYGLRNKMYYLNIIPKEVRGNLYEMLYVGITAYNRIIKDDENLRKSPFFINIKSRLLTFSIYRQFEKDMLRKEFPLKVEIKKVNNFGYNSLTLSNKKSRISLAKTLNNMTLPNKSKYRIKECSNNYMFETQLKFDLDGYTYNIEPAQTYMIIGFKIKSGELSHLNLMVPDTSMDSVITNINLLDEYNNWITVTKDEPHVEKQIVAIKKEATKLISNER
ncbi:hypothetical protein NE172_10955 [Clostridium botulinum]|uniref:Uncharacterized protein n=1 Tax=Clostridium botulinum TaxID=1491 RepID=A0A6B4JPQ1_CLOBO|nr:hypothetical protein [Clostridium botulinum]EES49877.1 hypothetical protein CLO_1869 [Clostridium botulinum E1 str. 'BoNT E Beluga']MBY6761846.1 hypothetical protein [Clostridium botulinum]MBY6920772.1 hypothetical protein [Clostridium botulinum]MCR1131480.1 hypothetical protein [Clostridium botulinum]NFJ58615.1 hypothetical protein [Clostridium botulinum]